MMGTDTAGAAPAGDEGPVPSVGIFWGVPDDGRTVLVTDRTPLAEAEAYGAVVRT